MKNIEMTMIEIVSKAGCAKSKYIEAISLAKEYKFGLAYESIEEGSKFLIDAHNIHADLIQKEAGGEKTNVSLIVLHAEDQLMSAETFKIIANEFIESYKKIQKLENK